MQQICGTLWHTVNNGQACLGTHTILELVHACCAVSCVWHVACCWPNQPHSQASSGYRSLNVAHTMKRHDTRATTTTATTTTITNNYNYTITMRTLTLNDFLVHNNNSKRQQIHNSVGTVYTKKYIVVHLTYTYISQHILHVFTASAQSSNKSN